MFAWWEWLELSCWDSTSRCSLVSAIQFHWRLEHRGSPDCASDELVYNLEEHDLDQVLESHFMDSIAAGILLYRKVSLAGNLALACTRITWFSSSSCWILECCWELWSANYRHGSKSSHRSFMPISNKASEMLRKFRERSRKIFSSTQVVRKLLSG